MNNIGIMQGRILPLDIKLLQVFPENTWEDELSEAKKLGFDTVELLYDKKLFLANLLDNQTNSSALAPKNNTAPEQFSPSSVCLDYFTHINPFDDIEKYISELRKAIHFFINTKIKVFVLPVLVEQISNNKNHLSNLLEIIKSSGLDAELSDSKTKIALEVNIEATKIMQAFEKNPCRSCAICYDSGNATAAGRQPEIEIEKLNQMIAHFHIKDVDQAGKNVLLGTGTVDFASVFSALDKINYQENMILETAYFENPVKEATQNLEYLKRIMVPA